MRPRIAHWRQRYSCIGEARAVETLSTQEFRGNFYVDITDYLQIELQALRLHASQVREPEFHGSPESLELTSRLRGREISVDSAEGFITLRAIF